MRYGRGIILTRDEKFVESGKRGEERVGNELKKICDGKYIHNVLLRYHGFISEICSVEIDYICILTKYIYVIEVKNWNTITRYDLSKDEYHVLINKKKRHIKSPIYQNAMHREMLSQLLNINQDRIICISVICTDDDSANQYVRDRNPPKIKRSHVIRIEELSKKIKEYEMVNKKELDGLENIWSDIERANWSAEKKYRDEHEEYCQKVKGFAKRKLSFPQFLQCNECGGIIVLGEKDGSYFGKCINYPNKCKRKTIPQQDFKRYIVPEWYKEGRIIYKMSIVEYENMIKKKQAELESIEKLVDEITLEPAYEKYKQYEEMKTLNNTLENKVLYLQEEKQKQEENIKKLLEIEQSMKEELNSLQCEKDLLEGKYQKTVQYKIKSIIQRIVGI